MKVVDFFSRVAFYSCVQDKECIWGALENRNGLCKVNIKEQTAKLVATFDNELLVTQRLYHSSVLVDNIIILVPACARSIAIFDMSTEKMKYIDLGVYGLKGDFLFCTSVVMEKKVYIYGYRCPYIIEYDVQTEEIIITDEWLKCLDNVDINSLSSQGFFADGYAVVGKKMYVPLAFQSAVLEILVLENEKRYSVKKIDASFSGISGMTQDNQIVWIVGNGENELVKWNMTNESVERIFFDEDHKCIRKNDYLWKVVCSVNNVYLLPIYGSKAYIYEKKDGRINEFCEVVDTLMLDKLRLSSFSVIGAFNSDDDILFFCGADFSLYVYNENSRKLRKIEVSFEVDECYMEKYYRDLIFDSNKKGNCLREENVPLNFFLDYIRKCGKR